MADYFGNTPVGERPSWWPNEGGNNTNPTGSNTGLPGFNDFVETARKFNENMYGTNMPPGGVAGGKISPNGLYWINPDGKTHSMANKRVTGALANGVDQSYWNIGKGDMFSGVRDGFLWVAGNRIMPQTSSNEEDIATLYHFGYRPNGVSQGGIPVGWQSYDGLGVGAPTGGAQGRWMGSRPIDEFRSSAGWAQQYSDEDLKKQLFTITQKDYDLYSPEQQNRIRAILGNSRPDLDWGDFSADTPATGNTTNGNNSQYTTNPLSDPLAGFRQWQQRRQQ